jgi:hypothetical protein
MTWSSSDAWLLTAACMTGESHVSLTSLIGAGDALNHAIFTDDELNEGMTKLKAAGLANWDGEAIVLTDAAVRLYEQAAAPTRYMLEAMENVDQALQQIALDESKLEPVELPPDEISDAIEGYQQRVSARSAKPPSAGG